MRESGEKLFIENRVNPKKNKANVEEEIMESNKEEEEKFKQ